MKIIVLDGYTLNPGDLSWKDLEALGPCRVYDRTEPGDVVERAADAEIVLTNKTALDRPMLDRLPQLRYIGVLATGYNVVDVQAARERGIPVTNVPTYGTCSVAQFTFALLLELVHHVGDHARGVRDGRWADSIDFCYWDHPLVELDGLTMGVVGYGRIGQAVAAIARAFGLKVRAFDPAADARMHPELTDLETLLRESDVVSLHCPLTEENRGLINAGRLAMMKPTAFLINTARGPLVDEPALAEALNEGRLAGAGLDVLSEEPPPRNHPLAGAKNCFLTPHIAWATRSARARLMQTVVGNVRAFLAGEPVNVVNA